MDAGIRKPICLSHYYSSVAHNRELGFIDELTSRGIPDAADRVFNLKPHTLEIGSENWEEIQEIFASDVDFDGVFAVGAYILEAARIAQARLPKDLQREVRFASFDYLEATYRSSEVIMSMFQPNFEMGVLAADLLLKQMNDFPDLSAQVCVASRFLEYRAQR
jgi:DNA-binding LacI/PurR family transcriptional regulator